MGFFGNVGKGLEYQEAGKLQPTEQEVEATPEKQENRQGMLSFEVWSCLDQLAEGK